MTPRRVLVIAYYFPPLGLSGVQRSLKFVKYLPEYGWHPTVLTVDERGYFAKDDGMIHELDDLPVRVLRSPSLDPLHFFRKKNVVSMPSGFQYNAFLRISQMFFIPDNKIGWKKYALRKAREELRETTYDAIFATAPPYTDFLIGAELKKEFHVPLILDYRDAWLSNPYHYYLTPFHRFLHHRLETKALRYANHVVTINRRIKELIVRENPSVPHQDVSIISQGFDPEDFLPWETTTDRRNMRITYAGSFYGDRTPVHFLRALQALFVRKPEARKEIEACFLGAFRKEDRRLVETLGLGDVVRVLGYQPHAETVRMLMDSDVLWMVIGDRPGAEMMSTGKLYEYIGARKPILACIPDGSAKEILDKHGAAFFAPPDDVDAILEQLLVLHSLFRNRKLPAVSAQFVEKFDRKLLTGQLARVFALAAHLGPVESLVETDVA